FFRFACRLARSTLAISPAASRMAGDRDWAVSVVSVVTGTRAACPTSNMYCSHLVRVGVMGNVGRFASPDAVHYPRGARVIVRTTRGLETGEVLSNGADASPDLLNADGALLRAMTVEDAL